MRAASRTNVTGTFEERESLLEPNDSINRVRNAQNERLEFESIEEFFEQSLSVDVTTYDCPILL